MATLAGSPPISASTRSDVLLQLSFLRDPKNIPPGIYVLPDEADLLFWHCVIFVRAGAYKGGVFRFSIKFPLTFTSSANQPPTVHFPPTLLHPLDDPATFRLTLKPGLPDSASGGSREVWQPGRNAVKRLFEYIRDVFTTEYLDQIDERDAVNKEVYSMYRMNRSLFTKLASQSSHLSTSKNALYDASSGSGEPASPYVDSAGAGGTSSSTSDTTNVSSSLKSGTREVADAMARRGIVFREMEEEEYERVRETVRARALAAGAPSSA